MGLGISGVLFQGQKRGHHSKPAVEHAGPGSIKLNDSSLDAYNPLDPTREGSNIDRILVDVFRTSETELTTFDIKLSNANLFDLPAGPVGGLVGFEWCEESFVDDRDPQLNGTIQFTDQDGDTCPFVSDVVNPSPTPDISRSSHQFSLCGVAGTRAEHR